MTMREKVYPLGQGFIMIDIHPKGATPPLRKRGDVSAPSNEAKKRNNAKSRNKRLIRLIHANFIPDGLVLHLTYKAEVDEQEAKAALGNFMRRLRHYYELHALPPLKYIAVTERGSENNRIHHHVVINGGIDKDACESLWSNGSTRVTKLFLQDDGVCALASYLLKGPIGARAWRASKGLKDPPPDILDGRVPPELAHCLNDKGAYARLYPGYELAAKESYIGSFTGGAHITAVLRKAI